MSGYDLSDCPDLSQFADLYRPEIAARGPEALRTDLLGAVREGMEARPRNHQREIGPSGIGHPCNRWLAHFFAETPPTGLQAPKWRAEVGTAVHLQFSDWLHRWNAEHEMRWLTDMRVWIGDLYPGRPITGHFDAFDTWTCTGIDLKIPGPSSMKRHGRGKPEDPQYAVQLDSYGVGATEAGLPVKHVGILRLPASGELDDAVWNVWPHDPDRARRALLRAGGIARMVDTMGAAAIAMQPTTEHFCGWCDFYRPGATDLTRACPGAETFRAAAEQKATPPTPSALLAV